MPDTRGDVLCPTCGQWTPPAPFCTECGAALQLGVQEPGESSPFRRGHEVDQPGSPWGSSAERFEPEPEDQAARAAAAGAAAGPRIDNLTEPEPPAATEWPPEPGLGAAGAGAATPAAGTPEVLVQEPTAPKNKTGKKAVEAAAAAAAVGAAAGADAPTAEQSIVPPIPTEPPAVEPPPTELPTSMPPPPAAPPPVTYAGPPRDGGNDGNGGVSGLVFVAFLGIGVLALLGGALLGGFFDGPVAEASPTPSVAVSTPTPEPTPEPTPSPSAAVSVAPSVAPIPTPPPASDDFIARAEPCDEQPSDSTCDNSGAVNDGEEVWILVSFRHGQPSDVIGVSVMDSSGNVLDEGSIPLSFCGTNTDCAGYTYFQFGGFAPGNYDVEATRNGEPAATTEFRVQ
jgi:hypothetical protein